MSDWLLDFAKDPAGTKLLSAFGLPAPVQLARAQGSYPAMPLVDKRVLLAAAPRGFAESALRAAIESAGGAALEAASLPVDAKLDVIVFDATGIRRPAEHRVRPAGDA